MIHLYFHGGSDNHGCEAIVRSTLGILGQDAVLHTSDIAADRDHGLEKVTKLEADVAQPLSRWSARYFLFALHHKLTGSDYLYTRFVHDTFFSGIRKGDVCLSIGGDNYCYGGQDILDTCDCAVALIPHVVSDLEVLRPLYDRFRSTGRVILIPDQDCRRLKYIISQCRLFLGARTHATIAAYSSLVPTLAVGYSVKSHGIARDLFGTDEGYVLPVDHIGCDRDLLSAYDHLAANAEAIKEQLRRVIPACRQKAADGRRYLEALTEGGVRP